MLSCGRMKTELFENADVTVPICDVPEYAHGSLGITQGHFDCLFSFVKVQKEELEYSSVFVADAQDIDDAVRKWTQIFSLILEKHAPTLRRRVSDKYTPWLNADYFKLAKTRDKLKTRAVKTNSKLLMESYKQIRNRLNNLNTQLKREYFSEKITQFQGDLKKTWKTINQVINKKSNTTVVPNLTVDG